jgi:hypothetical protein
MEDQHDESTGPQIYVLAQGEYDELRHTQTMLMLMAQVAYNDEDRESGNKRLVLRRRDVHYFFSQISAMIGNALDGVHRDNGMGPQSGLWQ